MLMFDGAVFYLYYLQISGYCHSNEETNLIIPTSYLKSEDALPVWSAMNYRYYLLQRYVEWLILRIRRH